MHILQSLLAITEEDNFVDVVWESIEKFVKRCSNIKRQEKGNFLLNSQFKLLKSMISKQISKEENGSMEAASTLIPPMPLQGFLPRCSPAKQASLSPLPPLPPSPRGSIKSPFHNISTPPASLFPGSAGQPPPKPLPRLPGPPPPPPLPGSAGPSFNTPLDQSTVISVSPYTSVIPLTKAKCKMREFQWVKIPPSIVCKNEKCIWFSVWDIPPLQADF